MAVRHDGQWSFIQLDIDDPANLPIYQSTGTDLSAQEQVNAPDC